jgi:hypothetical protein
MPESVRIENDILEALTDDPRLPAPGEIAVWDSELPVGAINVKVTDGWVTLDGYVNHQHQSDAAFEDISKLFGIYGITNKITVNEKV